MAGPFQISRIDGIGPELRALAACARGEGFAFLDRLITRWEDGSNRFGRAGEAYLGLWADGTLIAAGGLNRDPYADDDSIGRVRHFYVRPETRRLGAGRALIGEIVHRSRSSFTVLRLRTTTDRGAAFYVALGFQPCTQADASHVLQLAEP